MEQAGKAGDLNTITELSPRIETHVVAADVFLGTATQCVRPPERAGFDPNPRPPQAFGPQAYVRTARAVWIGT